MMKGVFAGLNLLRSNVVVVFAEMGLCTYPFGSNFPFVRVKPLSRNYCRNSTSVLSLLRPFHFLVLLAVDIDDAGNYEGPIKSHFQPKI